MTIEAYEHQRLLEAALEVDRPRAGEDVAARLRRVARELAEHRQREERHYGIVAASAMREGRG